MSLGLVFVDKIVRSKFVYVPNCNYFLSSEQVIVRIDVAQAFQDLTDTSCPPRDKVLKCGQVENAEVRKPKYGNGSTETKYRSEKKSRL